MPGLWENAICFLSNHVAIWYNAFMKIHEWVKTYHDRECLTQQQLADTIHCSVSSIRAWESGEREPSAAVLMRLTMLLGIPDSLEVMGMKFAKRNIPGTELLSRP